MLLRSNVDLLNLLFAGLGYPALLLDTQNPSRMLTGVEEGFHCQSPVHVLTHAVQYCRPCSAEQILVLVLDD